MKKAIISLFSILLILTGCGNKISWQDVQETYINASEEVKDIAENIEEITEADYQALLVELKDYVGDAEYSQDQDNQDLLKRTYKVAQYFESFASLFDGNCAQQLLSLSGAVKKLCVAVYDGKKDEFNEIKQNILEQIDEIQTWAKDQWETVEKKARLSWDSVVEQIETVEQNAKDSLTSLSKLAEAELDQYKHTIIDNYELIKDGITEETNDIAKQMYEAAIKLEAYTKKISNEESEKVKEFAKHAQSFIKQCYGKVLDEEEALVQDFADDVASAKKWTQSTWNEITKDLKLLVMPPVE